MSEVPVRLCAPLKLRVPCRAPMAIGRGWLLVAGACVSLLQDEVAVFAHCNLLGAGTAHPLPWALLEESRRQVYPHSRQGMAGP